ncbi:3-deoxy-7-phosphoheptulonate synthase [bacterium]|nr:3-deoxy-7-phosphoheptulonate synthase [bacterium]
MIVKMRQGATRAQISAVERLLRELEFETGKMPGKDHTLIGVYGDVSQAPRGRIFEMPGVEEIISISRAYKRATQKGTGTDRFYSTFPIGNVTIGGGDLVVVAGPCSIESERQMMEAARIMKDAGAHVLRGGVHKYRSSPYSGWEGIGAQSTDDLIEGLRYIVRAGREHQMPVVVEILDPSLINVYEDAGVDCLQIGEPNSRNTILLNALRGTDLPVIHKRGNSLDPEDYLLWVERMMINGKENIILCERGVTGPSQYTRNTLDLGSIAAFHHQLTHLPAAIDASHGTGNRDLVHPMTLAGILAGASVLLVEAHPNPLVAKSDGFQTLFPEQIGNLVEATKEVWKLRETIAHLYVPSAALEPIYEKRVSDDRERLFGRAKTVVGKGTLEEGGGDRAAQL